MTTQQPGYLQPQQGYPQPGQQGYPQPPGIPMTQPGAEQGGWAPVPSKPSNCPPGLEYLTMIDQLLVKQKIELFEVLTGFETANKYTIKNSMGQKVYYAAEDTDCCTRNCCGPARPFDIQILDNTGREVIHLNRPLRCQACCFPCCLQTLEVTAPPGSVVGYVKQEWDLCHPKFSIQNAAEETILRIQGPFCTVACCGDVEFKVLSVDGQSELGAIRKQWGGFIKEAFTDADNFGITFPMDLDVNCKATLLGALFLIDFMFFEKQNNKENNVVGVL